MSSSKTPSLHNLSLRARLVAGFSTVLLLIVVLTVIGIQRVNSIDQHLTTINDVNSVKQRHAIDYRGSVHDRAIALRDVTLWQDEARVAAAIEDISRLQANYAQADSEMRALFNQRDDITAEEQQALDAIQQIQDRALPLAEQVIAQRLAGNIEVARRLLLDETGPAFSDWLVAINEFIDLQESMNITETAAARELTSGFEIFMILLSAVAIAIGLLVAALLTRWLLRQLGAEPGEVRAFAEAIGQGKLSTRVDLRQGDRHSIMASLVTMAGQLQATVSNVRASANSVATGSEQIAEGNNELATRTEQQASALTETASSMEQLGSTVQQNAENSRLANEQASNASRIAEQGGEVMTQVVETMGDLNRSSKEIAEIITVIDSIAFQTNILALNASVEAARAGEHGRGFAVVASEVRQLAQRSAEAAKEINELITGNLSRAEEGSQLVARAGETTSEVVASIQRVTHLMGEISSASSEQSEGVTQVSHAVTQMDQDTQQNALLVGSSATIANDLRERARHLLDAMATFELAETPAGTPRSPHQPRDDSSNQRISSPAMIARTA
ncbi:methyl-accepting chemotaxis protein [Modicisalibacter radicis]|uniref:methyl-accepting chemotaxis protein n=1 Tax=Halomonas sp. EAR18 TaxID=2518972 RepID=UPI001FCE55E4|nr:methyl-accepting chemotaxis protein [Halomonas sp. EAR18]